MYNGGQPILLHFFMVVVWVCELGTTFKVCTNTDKYALLIKIIV